MPMRFFCENKKNIQNFYKSRNFFLKMTENNNSENEKSEKPLHPMCHSIPRDMPMTYKLICALNDFLFEENNKFFKLEFTSRTGSDEVEIIIYKRYSANWTVSGNTFASLDLQLFEEIAKTFDVTVKRTSESFKKRIKVETDDFIVYKAKKDE